MTKVPKPDFLAILRILSDHRVDFIIVGGVCAVLHGAPVSTFDLDLVHSRTPENVERLLAALTALTAYARGQGARRIVPDRSHLSSPAHQLLMTRFGPLDLLGSIGKGSGYEELLPHTSEVRMGELRARLLSLEALIRAKEETARDKDAAVLPILRRTLEERRKA